MTVQIDLGKTAAGATAFLNLEELLSTRLLIQGNSGSGKSHTIRRLLERSAPHVQQAIIDPEGDFVSLAEVFGHVVVDASTLTEAALQQIGGRVRQHRVSVVLNLENLDSEQQMRQAAAFLGGMFDVAREHWYPVLVVVDEAQMFAPAAAGDVSDDARKASLGAMTNLMCRGRKRGLAGVIATQRLAKLAKNCAAEASNFLMGRTFLDIDMARAADLLGMERRQAEMFRDLNRGHFIGLGPAIARRPLSMVVGAVETAARSVGPQLTPLPAIPSADAKELLFTAAAANPQRYSATRPAPKSAGEVMRQIAVVAPPPPPPPPLPPSMEAEPSAPSDEPETAAVLEADAPSSPASSSLASSSPASYETVIARLLAEPGAASRPSSVLYQDFLVACRSHQLNGRMMDPTAFRRRVSALLASSDDGPEPDAEKWDAAMKIAATLPEDSYGVFLLVARAALTGQPSPSDTAIARARGSHSARRGRSLLTSLEQQGAVVCREEFDGSRTIAIPQLDCETAAGDPHS